MRSRAPIARASIASASIASLAASLAFTLLSPPVAAQQSLGEAVKGAVQQDVKELRHGPLLIHGNYCGIGGRPEKPPIDDLDAACMRHDACTHTGTLPSCACDDRLRIEATAIAEDPRTPPDLKIVATATAAGMAVLICKAAPKL